MSHHDDVSVKDVCKVGIVNKKDKQNPPKQECMRCGKCCASYSFWLGIPFDVDLARLLVFHGCTPVKNPENNVMGVRISNPCLYLNFNSEGQAICEIYETRPKVCEQFFCKKCKI